MRMYYKFMFKIFFFWIILGKTNGFGLEECEISSILDRTIACEHHTLQLECPTTGCLTVLNIASSNYGRTSTRDCDPSGIFVSDRCYNDVNSIVQSYCQGQNKCHIEANDSNFGGDPCEREETYLEVHHQCTCPHEVIHTVTCQNEILNLHCSDDNSRVINILSTNYGRRDETTCAGNNIHDDSFCYMDVSQNVKNYCQGMNVCHMNVTNENLGGDPCIRHHKYLDIYHQCACSPGYVGLDCIPEICASDPCLNNATCLTNLQEFTCECANGYTGQTCETKVDFCSSMPCFNQASCDNVPDGFLCTCQEGFTGFYCETDIDYCSSNPCHNGGTCTDTMGSFVCQCDDHHTGNLCKSCVEEQCDCHYYVIGFYFFLILSVTLIAVVLALIIYVIKSQKSNKEETYTDICRNK